MGFTAGGGEVEKTAEQKAIERRQRMALDKETAQSEKRLKAIARGKLGKASLLGTPEEEDDFAGRKPKTIFDVAGSSNEKLKPFSGNSDVITPGYGITKSGKFDKMAVSSTGSGRDQVRVDQVNRKKFGAETTNKTSMGRNDPRRKKK
jgi:hypothetical protein